MIQQNLHPVSFFVEVLQNGHDAPEDDCPVIMFALAVFISAVFYNGGADIWVCLYEVDFQAFVGAMEVQVLILLVVAVAQGNDIGLIIAAH